MTEPEQLKEELDQKIKETMEEAGFYDVRSKYQELKDTQQLFKEKKNSGTDLVRTWFEREFDSGTTVADAVKIREDGVYRSQSPSKATKKDFRKAIKSDQITDEEREAIESLLEMESLRLIDTIQNRERILMDDEREFDAVILKLKRGRTKLKLVRLDGGKNHRQQPLEDIEDKHVEELHKFITYGDEKKELIEEMTARANQALLGLEEREERLMSMEGER